ncbi:MAG: TonB-dependent receptor, partial [Peristeroidobacter soli]
AEEFYSATNVGPTTAFVQMPPNAPATALLGLGAGLQPEKSTNYSVGFVLRPEGGMAITFDLYQVEVRNRIAGTSTFYGTIDGEPVSDAIVAAIIANGNVLDPEVTASGDTGINLFANGVTTETRGADLMFDFASDFVGAKADWTIAATYNETEVTSVRPTPAEFGTTQSLFDKVALSDLEETSPKYLVNFGASLEWDRLSLSLHELVYGPSAQNETSDGSNFYRTEIGVTPITNFEVSFEALEGLSVSVGATNAFDKLPPKRNGVYRALQFNSGDNSAVAAYPSFSPFGINGAYYYG